MKIKSGDTLGRLFENAATRFPENEAIVQGKERINYEKYLDRVNCIAHALHQMGVKKGEKTAILMPNSPEWAYAHFAAAKLGSPVVGINTRSRLREIEDILKQSDATTLFLADHFLKNDYVSMIYELIPELRKSIPNELKSKRLPLLKRIIVTGGNRQYEGMFNYHDVLGAGRGYCSSGLKELLEEVSSDDIYGISFTSGTTGTPKGIVTSHYQFIRSMQAVGDRLEMAHQNRLLVVSPFNHGMGNKVGMSMAASYGACMLPMQEYDAGEALRIIEEEGVTTFTGSPTMYRMMMDHHDFIRRNTRSIKKGHIGGADVQPELVKAMMEKMGIRDVISSYGMAEIGVITMTRIEDTIEVIANTSGRFMYEDCEIKILNPESGEVILNGRQGEICVKGWFIMKEYYKKPKETAKALDQNGWFHTGDLGKLDIDGNLKITGRLKDMFITGGLNVYPAEVENYLMAHPKIANVAVIGVPDERMGEVSMAFIQLKESQNASGEEIIEFARTIMANYKAPKYVEFIEDLPVTPTGKIKKHLLRTKAIKNLGLNLG